MTNLNLYPPFKKWTEAGTIWIYSDPHFGDEDCYRIRFPEEFNLDELDNIDKVSLKTMNELTVKHLDLMQIKNINKVCGKNDTLIILGDVGNIKCVKYLKAGYKVLVLGNHDKGVSNYQRNTIEEKFDNHSLHPFYENGEDVTKKYFPRTEKEAITKYKEKYPNLKNIECVEHYTGYDCYEDWLIQGDNNLFDEVYDGTLQISRNIILSHEPVDYKYCLNIHGHDHNVKPFGAYYEKIVNGKSVGGGYNCCAEQINYTPVNFNNIFRSGVLKNIPNIHQETIDEATERKYKND